MTAAAANFSGLITGSAKAVINPATTPTTAATATQLGVGEATNNASYRLNLGYWIDGGIYRGNIDAITGGTAATLTLNSTGGLVGIGMTPSNVLDITQTQNAGSTVKILNANASTAAFSGYVATNGSGINTYLLQFGSGYTSSGAAVQNSTLLQADNTLALHASAGTLRFYLASTEAARFSSSGKFYVGQTGSVSGGVVEFTANASVGLAINCGTSGAALYLSSSFNGIQIQFGNAGNAGNISSSAGSTAYNATSDIRRKDINVPQLNYRDAIQQMWVGNFTRFANFEHTGDSLDDFGILAQQAYPLFPNAITKPDSDDGVWTAENGKFGLLALWGVKDLYAENEALKARITALENK
jgi:hypothetical protein